MRKGAVSWQLYNKKTKKQKTVMNWHTFAYILAINANYEQDNYTSITAYKKLKINHR